jgi:hypothetical protein
VFRTGPLAHPSVVGAKYTIKGRGQTASGQNHTLGTQLVARSTQLDEHGTELPDLEAACKEARKILGAILSDDLCGASDLIHLTIMIDDASGHRVGNIKTVTRVITTKSPFAE